MPTSSHNYRAILRDNLRRLFQTRGYGIKSPPDCYYLDGPKQGRKVSQRTIQNIWTWREDSTGPAPGVDVIAAIAVALKLHPWELLVPDHPAGASLMLTTEQEVEARIARERAKWLSEFQGRLTALMRSDATEGRSTAANDGTDSEVPSDGKSGTVE
jgi:hypothetical protein